MKKAAKLCVGLLVFGLIAVFMLPSSAPADNSSQDWYFAEGNTLPEFDTYILLYNSGDQTSDAELEFMLDNGEVTTLEVTIGPYEYTNVSLKDQVEGIHDGVSTHVHVDSSAVICERPIYFNYHGVWPGGHNVVGLNVPRKEFYFAEGTTRSNPEDGSFDTWLTIMNPNNTDAGVAVSYMLATGENVVKEHMVAAHSRKTVYVNDDIGPNQDISMIVKSDIPIVAERPMYFDYHGSILGGTTVIGAEAPGTDWYFAEGTTRAGYHEYICIENPNQDQANVSIKYLLDDGDVVETTKSVQPRSRYTVRVSGDVAEGRDVSAVVSANMPVVCERPIYFVKEYGRDGGTDCLGFQELSKKYVAQDDVRPLVTSTYFTILNPGDTAGTLNAQYRLHYGPVIEKEYALKAHSRTTINLFDVVEEGVGAIMYFSSDTPIAIEEPEYIMYFGNKSSGSCIPAYAVPQ